MINEQGIAEQITEKYLKNSLGQKECDPHDYALLVVFLGSYRDPLERKLRRVIAKSNRRKKALRELNKAIQLQSTALRLAYCREELKKKNG